MNATTEARRSQAETGHMQVTGIMDFATIAGAGFIDLTENRTESLICYLLERQHQRPSCLDPLIDAVQAADLEAWNLCQENLEDDEGGDTYAAGGGFDWIDGDSGSETLIYHLALRSIYGIALHVRAPVHRYLADGASFSYSEGYTRGAWVYGSTYEEAWAEAVKWSDECIAREKADALKESVGGSVKPYHAEAPVLTLPTTPDGFRWHFLKGARGGAPDVRSGRHVLLSPHQRIIATVDDCLHGLYYDESAHTNALFEVTFEAPYAGSIGKFLGLGNALRAAVAFLEEN